MDDLDTDGTSIEIALDYGGQEDLFGDEFDDGASLMSSMQNVLPGKTHLLPIRQLNSLQTLQSVTGCVCLYLLQRDSF
jgi:hypothetical protein